MIMVGSKEYPLGDLPRLSFHGWPLQCKQKYLLDNESYLMRAEEEETRN